MKRFLYCFTFLLTFSKPHAQEETKDWFPFQPTENRTTSVINMKRWLDAPAGKHGYLKILGSDLQFQDGTPVKFWGVNIASEKPFVPNTEAAGWTDFLASYGINAVRFHKFTWDASDGRHSTQLADSNWQRFDYFCDTLRKAGIYYAWSHIYGHRVLPGDSSRLLAYSELANMNCVQNQINFQVSKLL